MIKAIHSFPRRGRLTSKPAAVALAIAVVLSTCCHYACVTTFSVPRLAHGAASKEALIKAVLQSLREGDLQKMKDLSLQKEEFQRFIWPELPVSNPKTNVPLDYVWKDLSYRSMNRMQATFNKMKGKHLELVRIVHRGKVVKYKSHCAYPDMEVFIREPGGKEFSYPLVGTLIELDGLWKVYSYAPYD
jgi:hypothetical protein